MADLDNPNYTLKLDCFNTKNMITYKFYNF